MAFSLLPREDDYFIFFSQMSAQIKLAADALFAMLGDDSAKSGEHVKRIKDIEHNCDEINHGIISKLNKSFITPFDREDIYALSVALDDLCDYIDAAARAVVMYRFGKVNDYSRRFAQILQKIAIEIDAAIAILKKPENINQHLVEIHSLENAGDDLYFQAVGELFQNETEAVELIKWKELYEILENAVDRGESIANIIESIILKHT